MTKVILNETMNCSEFSCGSCGKTFEKDEKMSYYELTIKTKSIGLIEEKICSGFCLTNFIEKLEELK